MGEKRELYIYSMLTGSRSTRILTLYGADSSQAPIECHLEERHLDDAGLRYEAISYCWGGQTPSEPVYCNDRLLTVTPNCAAILRRFRPSTEGHSRSLWIDAICIDQASDDERSSQIKLMGHIYRNAEMVLVWLGGNEQSSQLGRELYTSTFDWLVQLADVVERGDGRRIEERLLQLAHDEAKAQSRLCWHDMRTLVLRRIWS